MFCAWLAPALASLKSHVRREIRLLELESRLPTGQIALAEVLDEVLIQAYEQFPRRPDNLALDLWLVQLAEDVLQRFSRTLGEQSLNDRTGQPTTEPAESARDTWTEWVTDAETVELSELLPSIPSPESWDSLSLERKHVELDRLLGRLPRLERQTLVLNAVYGFSAAEVGDFQNRSPDAVLADIAAARRSLERDFQEEYLDGLAEQLELQPRHAVRRRG